MASELIARLISAGMPREVALAVYRTYRKTGNMYEFERYVESVEAEIREPMEEL